MEKSRLKTLIFKKAAIDFKQITANTNLKCHILTCDGFLESKA